MDSFASNSNGYLSSIHRSSQGQPGGLDKFDAGALAVLVLENALTRRKSRLLMKELFISRLKSFQQCDTIDQPEIAPLTRNSQPNESSFSFKKSTGDSLTRAVTTFREASHSLSNEQLLAMYKQRINEVDRLVAHVNQEKRVLEQREKALIVRLKGLKFQSVATGESACQTEIKLDELTRKETELKQLEMELRSDYQQRSQALEERESYLKYLEEALAKKQEQLQVREGEMAILQSRLSQEDIRYRTQPLNMLADSKSLYEYFAMLKDRIYEAVEQFEQGREESLQLLQNHPLYSLFDRYEQVNAGKDTHLKLQILKLLEVSSLQIRYKLEVAEDYFRAEYDKVIDLREALEDKNSKFIQLHSYESYLDRYKKLLDVKEKELADMRSCFRAEVKNTFDSLLLRKDDSDRTINNTQSQLSGIRSEGAKGANSRNRIFSRPNNRLNTQSAVEEDKDRSSNFEEERKYMSVKINQMKEEYHKRIELLQHGQENSMVEQVKKLQDQNTQLRIKLEKNKVALDSSSISKLEVSQENVQTALQNAKKKQQLVKFLTEWLGLSFRKNIKHGYLSKTFAFGLWRMRQYDPTVLGRIVQLSNEQYDPAVQKLWTLRCDKQKKDKLFPYKSLPLKRKEFMEEFFDLQRKQFFKNRMRSMMRSILRNKTRKERLVKVVAFHRFARNCALIGRTNKPSLLKQFKQLPNNTHSEATIAQKPQPKKSNSNSRATLQYESNKTSQLRDRSFRPDKQNEQAAERQRAQMQHRIRRTMACSKLFSFASGVHCRFELKKSQAFYRWSQLAASRREQYTIRCLDSKFEQLQFKMNLNNTKNKLAQSSIGSKLELLEELLSIVQP